VPYQWAEIISDPNRELKVAAADRKSILRVAATVLTLSGASLLLPALAEAQSRGTLQASATVVDASPSIQMLGAAQSAISHWLNPATKGSVGVTTLAQVSVNLQPATQHSAAGERQALVVRIDYLNN
jgi:hypothetical protein